MNTANSISTLRGLFHEMENQFTNPAEVARLTGLFQQTVAEFDEAPREIRPLHRLECYWSLLTESLRPELELSVEKQKEIFHDIVAKADRSLDQLERGELFAYYEIVKGALSLDHEDPAAFRTHIRLVLFYLEKEAKRTPEIWKVVSWATCRIQKKCIERGEQRLAFDITMKYRKQLSDGDELFKSFFYTLAKSTQGLPAGLALAYAFGALEYASGAVEYRGDLETAFACIEEAFSDRRDLLENTLQHCNIQGFYQLVYIYREKGLISDLHRLAGKVTDPKLLEHIQSTMLDLYCERGPITQAFACLQDPRFKDVTPKILPHKLINCCLKLCRLQDDLKKDAKAASGQGHQERHIAAFLALNATSAFTRDTVMQDMHYMRDQDLLPTLLSSIRKMESSAGKIQLLSRVAEILDNRHDHEGSLAILMEASEIALNIKTGNRVVPAQLATALALRDKDELALGILVKCMVRGEGFTALPVIGKACFTLLKRSPAVKDTLARLYTTIDVDLALSSYYKHLIADVGDGATANEVLRLLTTRVPAQEEAGPRMVPLFPQIDFRGIFRDLVISDHIAPNAGAAFCEQIFSVVNRVYPRHGQSVHRDITAEECQTLANLCYLNNKEGLGLTVFSWREDGLQGMQLLVQKYCQDGQEMHLEKAERIALQIPAQEMPNPEQEEGGEELPHIQSFFIKESALSEICNKYIRLGKFADAERLLEHFSLEGRAREKEGFVDTALAQFTHCLQWGYTEEALPFLEYIRIHGDAMLVHDVIARMAWHYKSNGQIKEAMEYYALLPYDDENVTLLLHTQPGYVPDYLSMLSQRGEWEKMVEIARNVQPRVPDHINLESQFTSGLLLECALEYFLAHHPDDAARQQAVNKVLQWALDLQKEQRARQVLMLDFIPHDCGPLSLVDDYDEQPQLSRQIRLIKTLLPAQNPAIQADQAVADAAGASLISD